MTNRTRTLTAAVLGAVALTGCGSDAPARTDVPVTTAPSATAAPAAQPTPAATASGAPGASTGQVDAPEVVAAVGQDRALAAAQTAETLAGTAMGRCTERPEDVLAGLQDLLTPETYAEAQTKVGGFVLVIDAPMVERCVRDVQMTVDLAMDGPDVLATAQVTQTVTALRDGTPADLRVSRTYDLLMQPTADGGWVIRAITTSDPVAEALEG